MSENKSKQKGNANKKGNSGKIDVDKSNIELSDIAMGGVVAAVGIGFLALVVSQGSESVAVSKIREEGKKVLKGLFF